ncbi:MAG: aldo/keto reductase [Thaumarchaeota archaeon]|nr:aldo/keto reductase [Nitrososphaerota archaeon]
MEKRELGRTREKIPVIGMGTWEIGDVQNEGRALEIQALHRGIELGMTMIDTAEMYGYGNAEKLVGQAIKGMRDQVFIVTKASPQHFGYEDLLSSCEGSIRRLGVEHIDLYLLHWPSRQVPIGETMKAMEELVSRGKIRYIGVSNFSITQTLAAREALPRSEIACNEVRYSLTHRTIESELLPFCEKEKLTVMAYSPLDTGKILTSKVPRSLLDKYGMTPAQLMLNWVTYREAVVAIPKAAKFEHVEENAAAVSSRISADDYQVLSRTFD